MMITSEQLQKEMQYFLDYGTVTELIEMLYCAVADKEHDLDELNKKKCEGIPVTIVSQVLGRKNCYMDDKKDNPKFTPTVAINKISSPFINKTESTGETVKFDCIEATHKSE